MTDAPSLLNLLPYAMVAFALFIVAMSFR